LIGQRHKVARPHTGLAWDKQATSRGLEDADADNVANTELDLRWWPVVAKKP
jgi:hypothetical protein